MLKQDVYIGYWLKILLKQKESHNETPFGQRFRQTPTAVSCGHGTSTSQVVDMWQAGRERFGAGDTVDGNQKSGGNHQLRLVVFPINCRVLYIPGGWDWDF